MQIFMSFFFKSPFPLLRSFPRFIGGHHGCKGTAFFACMQVLERKKHIKHAAAQKHIKNIVLNQKRGGRGKYIKLNKPLRREYALTGYPRSAPHRALKSKLYRSGRSDAPRYFLRSKPKVNWLLHLLRRYIPAEGDKHR